MNLFSLPAHVPFLDAILFLLGIPREEVEEAQLSWDSVEGVPEI